MFNLEFDRLRKVVTYPNWQPVDIISQYMSDFGFCNAWRSCHHTLKEYTFSSVHHSYICLDYLTSNLIIMDISHTQIHPITISDHAAVTLTVNEKIITPPIKHWRFNIHCLRTQIVLHFLKKSVKYILKQMTCLTSLPKFSGRQQKQSCEVK